MSKQLGVSALDKTSDNTKQKQKRYMPIAEEPNNKGRTVCVIIKTVTRLDPFP